MLPTTTKITKEMILNTAFEIAREKGFEKISNRELAKKMNCSIRPIYYQFKNVEELNKELYKKIERYFYEFLIDNMIKDVPLYKQIGINYIKFAIAENNLFKFLFMTEIKDEPSAFITTDEKGFEELVKAKIESDTTIKISGTAKFTLKSIEGKLSADYDEEHSYVEVSGCGYNNNKYSCSTYKTYLYPKSGDYGYEDGYTKNPINNKW